MNENSRVKFQDGAMLQRKTEAPYFGHHLTQSANVRHEANHKMQETNSVWRKLSSFGVPFAVLLGDHRRCKKQLSKAS